MRYLLILLLIIAASCSTNSQQERPNVLLILVDDMGYSDIGCYGGEIETPNLDKLAAEGLRFSRYYNTAKCFPSRACLLTGLYAQNNGMANKATKFTNAVTIAEVLRESGYRTLMTGKHHGEENPFYFGFDRYFGLKDGSSNHFNMGLQREGEVVPAHKKGKFQPREWGIDSVIHDPTRPRKKTFTPPIISPIMPLTTWRNIRMKTNHSFYT